MIKLLRPSYLGYAEDNFYIIYSQYFFQPTYDRNLFSKIRLDISPTFYKFIVWACWAETQPCLGSKPKWVLTIGAVYGKTLVWSEGDSDLTLEMEEPGSHQPTIGPHQDDANLHQAELGGSQHNNSVVNPQQRGGHEGSMHTTHTSKSQSWGKSHVSHAKNERDMQREIDELKKELRRARWRHSSPDSELSSEETDDATYKRRSKTLPSETFSYDEEYRHRRKNKSPTYKGLGNNAMNEALSQVAKSPFTRNIEGASLPHQFHQPTFTLYNGQTDPVEHVSHFSHKMAVHSRDEALMCKIFPSSLGPMAMRWFNGLKANSIDSF